MLLLVNYVTVRERIPYCEMDENISYTAYYTKKKIDKDVIVHLVLYRAIGVSEIKKVASHS